MNYVTYIRMYEYYGYKVILIYYRALEFHAVTVQCRDPIRLYGTLRDFEDAEEQDSRW